MQAEGRAGGSGEREREIDFSDAVCRFAHALLDVKQILGWLNPALGNVQSFSEFVDSFVALEFQALCSTPHGRRYSTVIVIREEVCVSVSFGTVVYYQ